MTCECGRLLDGDWTAAVCGCGRRWYRDTPDARAKELTFVRLAQPLLITSHERNQLRSRARSKAMAMLKDEHQAEYDTHFHDLFSTALAEAEEAARQRKVIPASPPMDF